MVDAALRIAAGLLLFTGIGFGLPAMYGMQSLAAGNGVPLLFGFPSYGGGPFERHGIPSTVPLLAGFLVVCVLELVAAGFLWFGRAPGALLALILLVPGALYWWGFALPIPPVLAVARTTLILWRWDLLR